MNTELLTAVPVSFELVRPPADLLLEREANAETLVFGRWSVTLRGAEIDDITFDGVLVVRSIRLVIRDEDWGTLPMHVDRSQPQAERDSAGTGLRFHGRSGASGDTCAWTVALTMDDATLRVHARVEATTAFHRNRLGLVVLHPPALAGCPLTVEHTDGTVTSTVFPQGISPHQPAVDIRALSWRNTVGAGESSHAVDSILNFSGDVFEMEDQRNWTDASFKTYSTPLSEPFPVELQPGTVVEQDVELICSATGPTRPATEKPRTAGIDPEEPTRVRVTFDATDAAARLPEVTTSVSSGPASGPPVPDAFGPLLCELDPSLPTWRAILDRAETESGGRPLDLRLVLGRNGEANPVLDHILDARIPTARIGVFDRRTHVSEPGLLTDLHKQLEGRGMAAELLGGTRAHFTELNRNFSRLSTWDGALSFSITPFMHDRGGHQLTESIAMQRLVVREALDIAQGRPLHIGPITLGARFNAVATSTPPTPRSDKIGDGFGAELVPGASDLRQAAPSLGAWVLASVAALALPGVESLSYFESSGRRGLRSADGHATAAGVLLGWVAELSGGAVARLTSSHPAIVGLAVSKTGDPAPGSDWVGMVGNIGDSLLLVGIEGAEDVALEPGSTRRVLVRMR